MLPLIDYLCHAIFMFRYDAAFFECRCRHADWYYAMLISMPYADASHYADAISMDCCAMHYLRHSRRLRLLMMPCRHFTPLPPLRCFRAYWCWCVISYTLLRHLRHYYHYAADIIDTPFVIIRHYFTLHLHITLRSLLCHYYATFHYITRPLPLDTPLLIATLSWIILRHYEYYGHYAIIYLRFHIIILSLALPLVIILHITLLKVNISIFHTFRHYATLRFIFNMPLLILRHFFTSSTHHFWWPFTPIISLSILSLRHGASSLLITRRVSLAAECWDYAGCINIISLPLNGLRHCHATAVIFIFLFLRVSCCYSHAAYAAPCQLAATIGQPPLSAIDIADYTGRVYCCLHIRRRESSYDSHRDWAPLLASRLRCSDVTTLAARPISLKPRIFPMPRSDATTLKRRPSEPRQPRRRAGYGDRRHHWNITVRNIGLVALDRSTCLALSTLAAVGRNIAYAIMPPNTGRYGHAQNVANSTTRACGALLRYIQLRRWRIRELVIYRDMADAATSLMPCRRWVAAAATRWQCRLTMPLDTPCRYYAGFTPYAANHSHAHVALNVYAKLRRGILKRQINLDCHCAWHGCGCFITPLATDTPTCRHADASSAACLYADEAFAWWRHAVTIIAAANIRFYGASTFMNIAATLGLDYQRHWRCFRHTTRYRRYAWL